MCRSLAPFFFLNLNSQDFYHLVPILDFNQDTQVLVFFPLDPAGPTLRTSLLRVQILWQLVNCSLSLSLPLDPHPGGSPWNGRPLCCRPLLRGIQAGKWRRSLVLPSWQSMERRAVMLPPSTRRHLSRWVVAVVSWPRLHSMQQSDVMLQPSTPRHPSRWVVAVVSWTRRAG